MSERANGVPYIDFQVLLQAHIKALPADVREDVESTITETGQTPLAIVNELAQSLFTSLPWSSTGFIAENFPTGKANAEFLISQMMHVDAVIHLKSDQEMLGARVIRDRQLKNAKNNLVRVVPLSEDEVKAENDELSDRVVILVNQCDETASLIEAISSIPVVEINANRFIRAISSEITEKTRKFIEYVCNYSNLTTSVKVYSQVPDPSQKKQPQIFWP
jgi:adenylate kinase family enzyme